MINGKKRAMYGQRKKMEHELLNTSMEKIRLGGWHIHVLQSRKWLFGRFFISVIPCMRIQLNGSRVMRLSSRKKMLYWMSRHNDVANRPVSQPFYTDFLIFCILAGRFYAFDFTNRLAIFFVVGNWFGTCEQWYMTMLSAILCELVKCFVNNSKIHKQNVQKKYE